MKLNILLSAICASILGAPVYASVEDNKAAHQAFSGESENNYQDVWYRELRYDDWVSMGVSKEKIDTVLDRIVSPQGHQLRDDTNQYSPGFWSYEFIQEANASLFLAKTVIDRNQKLALYRETTALFLIASYPNLRRTYELFALEQATQSYLAAAELEQKVKATSVKIPMPDGTSIPGLLHTPLIKPAQSMPALLWTGGVDKTFIEHKSAIQPMIDKGYAVLTFDMPGGGLDYSHFLTPGNEAANHEAAFEFLTHQQDIDENRIGVLSSSGSGISLVEFALKQPRLKAVVARCSLVAGPLNDKHLLKYVPQMSAHSLVARLGGDAGDTDFLFRHAEALSIENKGYFDGTPRISTPLLAITTKDDPVASPQDVQRTAALSTKGEAILIGESGHCPEGQQARKAIYAFLEKNV